MGFKKNTIFRLFDGQALLQWTEYYCNFLSSIFLFVDFTKKEEGGSI